MGNTEILKNFFGADALKTGGLLSPTQSAKFWKMVIDEPTILKEARVITNMKSDNQIIDKIGFGQRVLRPANEAQVVAEADRVAPTTEKVELSAKEVIADIFISDDSIENNIEGKDLPNTIMSLLAQRAALDIEELVVNGDRTSSDQFLALFDGLLKQADKHIVDAANAPLTKELFKQAYKAVPSRYRSNVTAHRFYVSPNNLVEWVDSGVNRFTNLGDSALHNGLLPNAYGIPVKQSPNLKSEETAEGEVSHGLFTHPKNIVVGFSRDVRLEFERNIRRRGFDIVLTAKLDAVYEESNAVSKILNIQEA